MSLWHLSDVRCPRCGSKARGYMRGPCAVWGKWHPWHNQIEDEMSKIFGKASK